MGGPSVKYGGFISQVWGGGHQSSMGGVINQLWGGASAKYGGVSIFQPVCTGSQNPQNYFSNTYVLPSRTAGPIKHGELFYLLWLIKIQLFGASCFGTAWPPYDRLSWLVLSGYQREYYSILSVATTCNFDSHHGICVFKYISNETKLSRIIMSA